MYIVLFVIALNIPLGFASSQVCQKWFDSLNLKPENDCLLECVSANVDMGTFHCQDLCSQFCKISKKTQIFFNLSNIYGLNQAEKALVAKYPGKMLNSYRLTLKADELCNSLFIKNDTNDASDACRHFVWAILLYEQFGQEFSLKVLNAHEQNPIQPVEEKAMDMANNRLGLLTARRLLKQNKLNKDNILESFKFHLNKGRLIVLKKQKHMKNKGLEQSNKPVKNKERD